ncbi:hypothetical protein BH10BAC2_BH10BAC2_42320 [soil metagenome]
MNRVLLITWMVCVSFPSDLLAQSSAAKTYAVVIGISTYQSNALPALKYADKDAGLFASYLQSKAGGNVHANQIKLLINEQATIAAVYDALDWLKETCKKGDVAYIYFSGHGDVETKNTFSLGYLIAYNTPPNNYSNNAIRIEDINNLANTLSIKNKAKAILITDACHSGKLAGDFYKGKQLVASQLRLVLNNEVRLTSCATDEEAAEGPDWGGGRGVFSYYLLLGLKGLADLQKDGTIKLQELNTFFDSSFASDKYLILDKHKQRPVTDGNPTFPLAVVDPATLTSIQESQANNDFASATVSSGLQAFKPVTAQPIDYFFSMAKDAPMESMLDFESYAGTSPATLPQEIVGDLIYYKEEIDNQRDSLRKTGGSETETSVYDILNLDSLKLFKNQLLKNKPVINRFNERFIQMVHEKGQEMINAYLAGDLAELEKRQYYYSGNRQYSDFISMLHIAMQLAPENHRLAQLLKVNNSYLSGLVSRMYLATQTNTDSLLNSAFFYQRQALQLEPYAAYIHNELGNLYLHKRQFDSADYHFNLATVLSPSWALPWANKIRMNLMLNNMDKAKEAIHKADSLQPNLSFSMMNAGLVMERDNNLLAAESLYKKAIAGNNVHFLPYARLGDIYVRTGRYEEADNFLYEAHSRKEDFAVNDAYFRYGVELGGIIFDFTEKQKDSCIKNLDITNAYLLPYIRLVKLLDSLDMKKITEPKAIPFLQELIQRVPGIPLANHYLGKLLFKQGQWQAAKDVLLQATTNYLPEQPTRLQLAKQLYGEVPTTDTCLLQLFMYYHYDVLEDHYMLGEVCEKLELWDKAIAQYTIISGIENKRQAAQAGFEGYPANLSMNQAWSIEGLYNKLMQEYEGPVTMGGTIKAVRLYEQQGQYLQAEKILLKQVILNRAAGDARQAALRAKKPGTWQLVGFRINFYWLSVNSDFEGEVYDFYQRMIMRFPRDFQWKEKAGLFLHHRLALAFNQMPVEEYAPFYESISQYAYPWQKSEDPPNEADAAFTLPGTEEKLIIKMPVYDPVKGALALLLQSEKLSPDLQPRREVAEAIADLYSWLGYSNEAIKLYKEIVNRKPGDDTLRNKLLGYLLANDELTDAYAQLDTLFHRTQIKPAQTLLLVQDHILSRRFSEATRLLKNYQPQTDSAKYQVMSLYAIMNWLSGQPQNALAYLQDSLPVMMINENDNDEIKLYKQQQLNFRWYSIARIDALEKNYDKAFDALQLALDNGFDYKYVLDDDSAWTEWRGTEKWNTLMAKYEFMRQYVTEPLEIFRNPIIYRIPGFVIYER